MLYEVITLSTGAITRTEEQDTLFLEVDSELFFDGAGHSWRESG